MIITVTITMLLICYCYWYYWWECDMYAWHLLLKKPLQSLRLLWQYLLIALDRLWPVNLLILFTLLSELVIINLNVMKGHIPLAKLEFTCKFVTIINVILIMLLMLIRELLVYIQQYSLYPVCSVLEQTYLH